MILFQEIELKVLLVTLIEQLATSDFRETLKTWTEIYIYETDRLAMHLYVPNYRNPAQARYRFNREGAEFIQALLTS